MFSNLVFYETPTSLYVLWQAMRRVWRLGQKIAVEVDFLAYKGTMEEEILSRMGRKMKFAQLLYGKDAAGVLIESDGDDLAREIIADALSGRTFKDIGDVIKEVKIFGDSKSGRAARTTPILPAPALAPALTSTPVHVPRGDPQPVAAELESLFASEPLADPSDEPLQLGFFWEAVPASQVKKSRRRAVKGTEGQLSLFGMPVAAD
jgi:hypothetical protein